MADEITAFTPTLDAEDVRWQLRGFDDSTPVVVLTPLGAFPVVGVEPCGDMVALLLGLRLAGTGPAGLPGLSEGRADAE